MRVIYPVNIEFKEWASQIRIDLPGIFLPNPPEADGWWDWASQVVRSNNLLGVPLPTKISFPTKEDWKIWAAYFVGNLYT